MPVPVGLLDPVLYRIPFIDERTGLVAQNWLRYFEAVSARLAALEALLGPGLSQTIVLASTTSIEVVEGVVTTVV